MRSRLALLSFVLVAACGGDHSAPPDAPPDGPQTTEVVCEQLPPVTTGTCSITPGGATTLLKGIVLTPATLYRGGQVEIDATGQIMCVGCDCATGGETTIVCPDGAISPGLINTHDHITFTQNQPYSDSGERYEDRQQWRKGQDGHAKIPSSGGATQDQISWGELRFLMGGATSIVGSGGAKGLLRNLDQAANEEGLAQPAVNFDTFPLDDSSGTKQTDNCNYGGTATDAASIAANDSYEPHTSEGIDQTARNEFLCESSDTYDTTAPGVSNNLLLSKTAMIHAIGLQAADLGAMAAAGTGLIWSPRSNITLYGDTARVVTAHRLGVEISLGTDWMPTGSMNLLRELKCADSLNSTYFDHHFTDVQLWQMVTTNAAAATATDDVIGLLAAGKTADISIFNAHGKTFRAVIEADPQDVVLVMRGGKVLYGDQPLVDATAQGCDALDVCGTQKSICLMSEVGKNLAALTTSVGAGMYPAFACGVPTNEPSCVPTRPASVNGSTIYTGEITADDSDGDGIPDSMDSCPHVFDPIRPVDDGMQGDADGDGVGDACDVCPLDANTNNCGAVDPNDRDHDGIANDVDNCPDMPNPDQLDSDHDGKGDVCDACPMASNPGGAGCPATIYDIKGGVTPVGTGVRVTNALVTGTGTNGFFVQVKETDTGYVSADNSGLFVFTGTAAPTLANATVGARVTIDGKVAAFLGQIELDTVTAVTVVAVGPESAPAPITTTYTEIKTGGTRAATLESVIVSVGAATVSANDAMFGEFTLTAGADSLIVDDFLFATTPLPVTGQAFNAAAGILTLRQSASKLEPRSAADLTLGPPTIKSFAPDVSFARVGVTAGAPTFPTPLTVTLTGQAQGDTPVTIISGDTNKLTVTNVTVLNGATTATVNVTAVLADPTAVAVTANLIGGPLSTAHVRVLGTVEEPTTIMSISPADTSVAPNTPVQYTVTLDTPALAAPAATVTLTATAGTIPASVTVAAGQTDATFSYTAPATGSATIGATFKGTTQNATVTISTGANHLVINEVDYDQAVNPDAAEFIEIYNPSGAAISLTGIVIVLINGADSTAYDMIDLSPSGSLPSHGYLVVAGANVTVTAPAIKLDPGWTTNQIQNGGTTGTASPDGIALINTTTHTLIDAISYEGSITDAALPGFAAPVSLVEGTAATAADATPFTNSICRSPDGQDTDNAVADWKVCVPSAGTANP